MYDSSGSCRLVFSKAQAVATSIPITYTAPNQSPTSMPTGHLGEPGSFGGWWIHAEARSCAIICALKLVFGIDLKDIVEFGRDC